MQELIWLVSLSQNPIVAAVALALAIWARNTKAGKKNYKRWQNIYKENERIDREIRKLRKKRRWY